MMRFPLELPPQPRRRYSKPVRMLLYFLMFLGAVGYWILFLWGGSR